MSKKIPAPVGERFCRLVVLREVEAHVQPNGEKVRRVECLCDCGTVSTPSLRALRHGSTKSCGCLSVDTAIARATRHGQSVCGNWSPNYRLWASIKDRVFNAGHKASKNYGGRGITMHQPWAESFEVFDAYVNEHLGPCPKECPIDRIDNNGHYEPGNIRWATRSQQANNKRNNVKIEFAGVALTVAQWSNRLGIPATTLRGRLFKHRWPIDRALTAPVARQKTPVTVPE